MFVTSYDIFSSLLYMAQGSSAPKEHSCHLVVASTALAQILHPIIARPSLTIPRPSTV